MSLGAVPGSILSVLGSPGEASEVSREAWRGLGEALEASWRPLGGLLELLKMLGRLRGGLLGAYGSLLEACWSALGGLLELSWTVLEASWAPEGRPENAHEGPTSHFLEEKR